MEETLQQEQPVSTIPAKKKRPSLRGQYDPQLESEQYDPDYYVNHTKYYDRGIPHFVDFLKENFKFDSIADIGCGTGAFVAPLQDEKKVFGFDFSVGAKDESVQQLKPENFYVVDLAQENATAVAQDVDIALSLEVYEHIYPAHEDTYVKNVFGLNAKYVIISCAEPGQIGRRHVNCKTKEDVTAKIAEMYPQYVVNEALTDKFAHIKRLASFYRKNTLVFERTQNVLPQQPSTETGRFNASDPQLIDLPADGGGRATNVEVNTDSGDVLDLE